MSKTTQILTRRWWKLPIWTWICVLFFAIAGVIVFSFFFVRRAMLEFRPEHTFTVESPEFFASAHALADPLPITGNRITLLHNGDETFPAMLAAIASAKQSVNFEAFLFQSGTVGSQFRDAFIERARAGVKVRVLLDGIGSGASLDNADVEGMRRAGCHVEYYHPTRGWRLDKLNRRTHRRVLVVDGTVAFTGGIGFSDEWLGHAQGPKHWRDVHAKIEGPIVAKMQGAFQQHWVRSSGEIIAGAFEFPALPGVGNLRAQVISSHSFSIAALPLVQATAIAAATRRVCITNPYCTPNDDQVEVLVAAVKRGVSVELLLPGQHHDQPATRAAGRTAYGKLLEGGVKIFEYQPTMIHSKTMVVDGLFSLLGTSNLDSRSGAINEEIDVSVYDHGFGKQMEGVFDADLKNARPYTLKEFKQRGLWERASEALTAPFHSQL